jgi:hypothetical protein
MEKFRMVKVRSNSLAIMSVLGSIIMCISLVASLCNADLVAHWSLDEGSGEDIADATGNGYDGIFKGNPTWVDGVYSKALEFDGDDHVEVPGAADIKPESITMSTWVWFDDVTGRRDFISRDDDYAFSLGGNPQDGKLWAVITTGGDWLDVGGATQVEVGKWYHVALTYDSKTKMLTLYLNGEKDGEGNAAGGMEHRRGGPLTIGTFQNRYLKGKLDDIKIWDEALSEEEVKASMEPASVNPNEKLGLTWGRIKSL